MNAKAIDAGQGGIALIGITLGAIPLVRALFTDDPGSLLNWIPGVTSTGLVVPIVVLVTAVLAIAVLERVKRRRA